MRVGSFVTQEFSNNVLRAITTFSVIRKRLIKQSEKARTCRVRYQLVVQSFDFSRDSPREAATTYKVRSFALAIMFKMAHS